MSSFVGRAVVFFFLLSVLLLLLYVVGNYQDFLDSTQLFLLMCLRVCLTLEMVTGVWLAGFLIFRNFGERRLLLVRWILLTLSVCASAVLLAALRLFQQWLQS
jgi:hypothetical protein